MARLLPLALALLLAACGGAAATGPPTGSAGGCAEGGVPEDGDMEGCEIRVGTCCYAEQRHACAAAGCAPGHCIVLESYPGQISCQ